MQIGTQRWVLINHAARHAAFTVIYKKVFIKVLLLKSVNALGLSPCCLITQLYPSIERSGGLFRSLELLVVAQKRHRLFKSVHQRAGTFRQRLKCISGRNHRFDLEIVLRCLRLCGRLYLCQIHVMNHPAVFADAAVGGKHVIDGRGFNLCHDWPCFIGAGRAAARRTTGAFIPAAGAGLTPSD